MKEGDEIIIDGVTYIIADSGGGYLTAYEKEFYESVMDDSVKEDCQGFSPTAFLSSDPETDPPVVEKGGWESIVGKADWKNLSWKSMEKHLSKVTPSLYQHHYTSIFSSLGIPSKLTTDCDPPSIQGVYEVSRAVNISKGLPPWITENRIRIGSLLELQHRCFQKSLDSLATFHRLK